MQVTVRAATELQPGVRQWRAALEALASEEADLAWDPVRRSVRQHLEKDNEEGLPEGDLEVWVEKGSGYFPKMVCEFTGEVPDGTDVAAFRKKLTGTLEDIVATVALSAATQALGSFLDAFAGIS